MKVKVNICVLCFVIASCAVQNTIDTREAILLAGVTVETLAEQVISLNESGQISDKSRADAKVWLQRSVAALQLAKNLIDEGAVSEARKLLEQAYTFIDAIRSMVGVNQ